MKTVSVYRPRVLENALSDFDRYMESFFGDNFINPSDRIFNRVPAVDVRENEKGYVLEADLPGFDEKDIEIRLDGNNLIISSRKAEEKNSENVAEAEGNYLIRERHYASFSRSFRLPENANPEAISASFRNGILSLEIGKRAEAQQRVIQISKS
ncbi:MAG: Hsp20/alpha crystallin family protein [Treponema sp.]|jgi:HSP20 family protein|nr:Hsp20/alpha crystallin family protein [Treponema sp.]